MRKLSKKISMLMVLAMLVGLFSGVVSASAASAWSFASSKYDVAVNGSINMESKEYADFDLLKDGKAPAGYTVAWASSDEDVVWVNAKTGQLRANKFGKAADGDKAVISATFTNTATKKSATRSFTIVLGAAKADFTVEADDVTIALGEEVKFAPVVKNAAGKVVKFATHKSYNGYFLDGKAIANPWTPEEAGEYTVTVAQFAKKANVADLAKAVRKTEVKVTVTVDDFSAKATKLREITVYGDFAKDATFTVKKDGNRNVAVTATIAEDGKSAILALTNRITEGIYTVTCGEATTEFKAEDERVESIVILEEDGQIYTNADRDEAYAHYDVFNQYGESIRKSADVRFTSSANAPDSSWPKGDPHTGIVTIKTVSSNPFNFSNVVVLTAVVSNYNNSAKSETATMTIGLENNIHSIKVKGVVLEGTNKLLESVPAEFAGGKYYMVFETYDRNGNLMEFDADNAEDDLTFVSVSPLVIANIVESIDGNPMKSVFIDGVEYGAVLLEAGQSVKQGGVAQIKYTSRSGGSDSVFVRVLCNQILDEFRVIRPEGIVALTNADGNTTEIDLEYEAYDVDGEKITNFRALINAVAFSDSRVKMVENADGSATLKASVKGVQATKEVDGQLVFSVIIPNSAKAENVTLYVKAARYADAVSTYEGTNEILEGDTLKVSLADKAWDADAKINFLDQYDELIKKGGAFGNTKIGVKVVAGGSGLTLSGNEGTHGDYYIYSGGGNVLISAGTALTETVKDYVIELAIFETKTVNGVTSIDKKVSGSEKKFEIKVVDLSQVASFSVRPTWWNYELENNTADTTDFVVEGFLANGNKVDVPVNTQTVGGSYIAFEADSHGNFGNAYSTSNRAYGANLTVAPALNIIKDSEGNAVSGTALKYFTDYSKKNADGSYVTARRSIGIKANIFVISAVSGNAVTDKVLKTSVSTSVNMGIDKRQPANIVLDNVSWWPAVVNKDNNTAVIKASAGKITYKDLICIVKEIKDNYGENVNFTNKEDLDAVKANKTWELDEGLKVTISNFKEGGKGLVTSNGKVVSNEQTLWKTEPVMKKDANGNDTNVQDTYKDNGNTYKVYDYANVVMLEDVEIGDTFTVTYSCSWTSSVTVQFTVGADNEAWFQTIDRKTIWK